MTDHRPIHRTPRRSRSLTRGLVVAVLLVVPLCLAVPAVAHPFGPPLQVELEGVNHNVNLRWTAADDDWLALARHVDAFDEVAEEEAGAQLSGAQRIARSSGVEDYILDHVAVIQHGMPCAGELVHLDEDLLAEGAIVQFTCEEHVYEVDIRVDLLTDVHPAYRTVAESRSGGTPGEALYTATDVQHTWDFGAVSPPATSRTPMAAIVGVAVLVAAACVLLWLGLRSPTKPAGSTDPARTSAAPSSPERTSPAPTDAAPTDAAPTAAAPTDPAPTDRAITTEPTAVGSRSTI